MSADWINTVDFCAANGLFDYDAPAYILGKPARYVGNPKVETYMNLPPLLTDAPKMNNGEPVTDEFNGKSTPTWKKVAVGASILAVIATGIFAFKKGIDMKAIKGFFSTSTLTSVKDWFKNLKMPDTAIVKDWANSAWTNIKKPFENIKNKFKKPATPPAPPVVPPTTP